MLKISYKRMERNHRDERLQKGHVLALPYPLQGHVNPMLQFSKRLQNKGVKVTIALTKTFFNSIADNIQSLSFPVETISDRREEDGLDGEEERGSSEKKPKNYKKIIKTFEEVGSISLGNLLEKLEKSGKKVDCIVYDAFIPWAFDVGKKYGVIGGCLFTQSCAVGNIYYHVYKGVIQIPVMINDEKEEDKDILNIPGLPPLQPCDLPSFLTFPQEYPAIADLVYNQFCNLDMVDWVFFNTFYNLEEEVIEWMKKLWNVRPIGPTVPSMYLDKRLQDDKTYGLNLFKPASDECTIWLKERKPKSVVYVSFGSLASLDDESMTELAYGLKLSGKYFLWVVRSSEYEKLPKNFIKETSDKGLIVTWCPQLEVLENESIGCFVTHSGWNSTLEAMALGVPMVVMPQWTDQTTNAKYVMDVWKTGVKAKQDEKRIVRKEVISNCIIEVMDGERGEEIKSSCIKWKKFAKEAMDEGGSSDKNIEDFVSHLSHSKINELPYTNSNNHE